MPCLLSVEDTNEQTPEMPSNDNIIHTGFRYYYILIWGYMSLQLSVDFKSITKTLTRLNNSYMITGHKTSHYIFQRTEMR